MTTTPRAPTPATKPKTPAAAGLVLASASLMAFLGVWEPDKRDPGLVYADKLANNIATVCKGLTHHVTATPIIVGERWSPEKCHEEEQRAVTRLQMKLWDCFTVPPPQSVFDMATSHGWNLGPSSTCGSAAMQAWRSGQWELGCRRLSFGDHGRRVWSFVKQPDGTFKFIQGLANRRDAETIQCTVDLPK